MSALVFDCEATGATNGTHANPFTAGNRLCYVGMELDGSYSEFAVEYRPTTPYGEDIARIQDLVSRARLLVGFNLKYDLHWLRRYGINFSHCNLWDVQLAFYILSGQKQAYPSLDIVADAYNLGRKLDVVRRDYWDRGLDTDSVPFDTLSIYCRQDVALTKACWLHQLVLLPEGSALRKNVWLNCQDLLVTQEMEWNGLKADLEKMRSGAEELRSQIAKIDEELNEHVPSGVDFNWNSGEHLSALIYGGVAKVRQREKFDFVYKDGRVAEKERWVVREYNLPRIVEPLQGTKLAKEGYYSTANDVLQKLPKKGPAKKIVGLLLERAKLEQKVSMYYEGWPELYDKMGWEESLIHPNLNHCKTATGRLSSSKPNEQNMDKEFTECITTRF